MEDERYIGRIESAFFKKGTYFSTRGYAIFVTNKRIFGVKRWAYIYKVLIKFELVDEMDTPFSQEDNTKTLAEFAGIKKDLELAKESITVIEMKRPKPPFLGGHIKFITESGKAVHIKIQAYGSEEYWKVKRLMDRFAPELVKEVPDRPLLEFVFEHLRKRN